MQLLTQQHLLCHYYISGTVLATVNTEKYETLLYQKELKEHKGEMRDIQKYTFFMSQFSWFWALSSSTIKFFVFFLKCSKALEFNSLDVISHMTSTLNFRVAFY